jgi:hypothetical protein
MIAFAFTCTPRKKSSPIIKGTFTQQDDHRVVIMTSDGHFINRQLSDVVSEPLNYLAKINSDLYPDVYKKITNLNDDDFVAIKTLAQKMKDADKDFKNKTTEILVTPSGHHFTPGLLDVIVKDVSGNDITLYDLVIDVKSVFIPIDGQYTKVSLMNTILHSNFVPYDVNRQIVKNLQAGLVKINKHFSENNSDSIFVIISNATNKSKDNCKIVGGCDVPSSRCIKLLIKRSYLDIED